MTPPKARPFFIAYRLTDPMVSPKIKRDESLVDLLDYLYLHHYRWHVYGPAIYYVPVIDGALADIKTAAIGIGIWMGGRKIRLFEFVEPPPAPGVEFIRQTEFIEGSEHGEEGDEEEVRDDGSGSG